MFTTTLPKTDSQLSLTEVTNLAIFDALKQINRATGLDDAQCLALIEQQLITPSNRQHYLCSPARQGFQPIINHQESDYIFSLFN